MGTSFRHRGNSCSPRAHRSRHGRLCAAAFLFALAAARGAPTGPTPVSVGRATIIAFFAPMSEAELKVDPDANEALADFQFYASHVREPLRKAGIEFRELRARSFQIQVGSRITLFRPEKNVGYYLIVPGKKPRVEYGVMSASDLMEIASSYFGIEIN